MSESIRKRFMKEEYEIQHYGFSSTDFLFQFRNIIDRRIDENLEDLEGSIGKKLNLDDAGKEKLHEEMLTLANFAKSKVIERFANEKFEEKIRNFFDIPEHILLSCDEIQYEDNGDTSVDSLTKEIEELEKQYKKDTLLINLYNQELEATNKLVPIEETFNNMSEQIKQWPKVEKYKKNYDKYLNLFTSDIKNIYVKEIGTCDLKSFEKIYETMKKCDETEEIEFDDL